MYEQTPFRKQNWRIDFPDYNTESIVTTRAIARVAGHLCPICKILYNLDSEMQKWAVKDFFPHTIYSEIKTLKSKPYAYIDHIPWKLLSKLAQLSEMDATLSK